MKKILIGTALATIVSFYVFSAHFAFLPHNINTKMLIAAFGLGVYLLQGIRDHALFLSRRLITAALMAVAFSLWCLFTITINRTTQTTYVDYWSSFATWIGGAYGVYIIIRAVHKRVDLPLLTKYLAIVCIAQCIIALMIDNIPIVKSAVQTVFWAGYDYYERIGRLYGIGCALDPAGVRFGCVLLLIAHQIAANPDVTGSKKKMTLYIIAFILITVIGSMIARTTSVGAAIALAYILYRHVHIQRGGFISKRQIRMFAILSLVLAAIVGIATYLYNTNDAVHGYLRFAFEGFFNWVETGEFRTTSTDILENMWIWPTTFRDWMIGTGRIGIYVWNTDIGYCNFVLYCGLIGLTLYASYYVFCALSLNKRFKDFYILSLLLLLFQAAVWAKVMTDIFFILALLMVIDGDDLEGEEVPAIEAT
ncbi:MAG: hypothetical protein IJL93_08995 [Bacteroidales bacterium]|nr:hypothetical protein [Bacteroidales bacterium]